MSVQVFECGLSIYPAIYLSGVKCRASFNLELVWNFSKEASHFKTSVRKPHTFKLQ